MKAFLSYPSERRDDAYRVFEFVRSLDTWFDKASLVAGQDWDRERSTAQLAADLTLLICSPETLSRAGVIQREIKDILKRITDQPLGDIFLVPLRTEEVRLPPELAKWQYIDLFRGDWQIRLAQALKLKEAQLGEVNDAVNAFIEKTPAAEQAPRSIRERTAQHELAADFFTYAKSARYWEFVNSTILSIVYDQYYSHLREFRMYGEPGGTSEWTLGLEEVFRKGDIVSLRFHYYANLYRSAHPSYGFFTRNFGGEDVGQLDLNTLIGSSEETYGFIKKACEGTMQEEISKEGGGFEFADYFGDYDWEVFKEFSIDSGGLTINLSSCSGLPHVLGAYQVRIPWQDLKDRIQDEFCSTTAAKVLGLA